MIFHQNLNDSKSLQVSRILLSILADLPMLGSGWSWCFLRFLTPQVFFFKTFGTFPSLPITIGITITNIFYGIFNSLERSMYLSIFLLSFNFIHRSTETAKFTIWQVFLFFFFFLFCLLSLVLIFWLVICLYLKIRENIVRFILQDGF